MKKNSLFEKVLSIPTEEIEFDLRSLGSIEWSDFLINPRRLRGSDFFMRWSQGEWSEQRLIDVVNKTDNFFAIHYGPSSVAPSGDIQALESYFDRLEKAGLKNVKRPDLLIFKNEEKAFVEEFLKQKGGLNELPFIPENELEEFISKAKLGIECENSLWKVVKMKDFNKPLTKQKRLEGKLGKPKSAVLPTVILKEEDRGPLIKWQESNSLLIHIWHVFYDRAYGISLNEAERLIKEKYILPTKQTFQAPGGATTTKILYKVYYHYAYPLAISIEEPELRPGFIEDKNGHILPYVYFQGGAVKLCEEALSILNQL